MRAVDITIKNYRCFSDTIPASIEIGPGFTSFVGPNNAGKSSVLRFFYEMRQLFRSLAAADNNTAAAALSGVARAFSYPPQILEPDEVFSKFNDRDITIVFEIKDDHMPVEVSAPVPPVAKKLTVTIPRGTNTYRLKRELLRHQSRSSLYPAVEGAKDRRRGARQRDGFRYY